MKPVFPQPPPIFVGRDREMENLLRSIDTFNLFLITGLPGVGKSSFAAALANALLEKENDSKIIWIDCNPNWDIDTILYKIIDVLSYYYPDKFPKPEEFFERRQDIGFGRKMSIDLQNGSWTSLRDRILDIIALINDKSLNIFIDNFEEIPRHSASSSINTLSNFLRGSRFIFISREQLSMDSSSLVDVKLTELKFLDIENSMNLAKRILDILNYPQLKESDLEMLINSTGGHPFLIKKTLGALLSTREAPNFTIPCRITSEYIEAELLKNLNPEEKNVLFILSIARNPIDVEGLEYISGQESVYQNLESLKYKMVVENDLQGRYYVHKLLKDALLKYIPRQDKLKIHDKFARYYSQIPQKSGVPAETLKSSFWHYVESKQISQSIKIFHQLFPSMMQYCQFNELLAMIDEIINNIDQPPVEIMLSRAEILLLIGRFKKSKEILDDLGGLQKIDQTVMKDIIYSKYLLHSGEFEESLRLIKKTEKAIKRVKNQGLLFQAMKMKADIYLDIANDNGAKRVLRQCLKKAEKPTEKADVLRRLGVIYYRQRKLEEALDTLTQAQNLLDPKREQRLTAYINGELGIIYDLMENHKKAVGFFEKALEFGREKGDIRCTAASYCNLGLTFFLMGKKKEGEKYLRKGVPMYLQWDYKKRYIMAAIHLAILYENTDQVDKALSLLEESMPITRHLSLKRLEIAVRLNIAGIHLARGNLSEAIRQAEIANSLVNKLKSFEKNEALYICNVLLAEIYFRKGDNDNFEKSVNQIIAFADYTSVRNKLWGKYLLSITGKKGWNGEQLTTEEVLKEINSLPSYDRFVINFSVERLKKLSLEKKRFLMVTSSGSTKIGLAQLTNVYSRKGEYDLWINTVHGEYLEKEKGELNLGKKRVLLPLLIFFMKNAGRSLTADEIYSNVWGGKYSRRLNYSTLRSSIIRLRDIIDPDKEVYSYIETKRSWETSETRWTFDNNANFCLITRQE